ncbi:GtrA family protein [Candidatus Saccharibacteria bacterium]|nr:GtrA family protein [Candidatus Saccharibacteria bacterium]
MLKVFIKFGIVGVINTVLSLVIYYICIVINNDWYLFGTVLGYVISSIVGYFLNKLMVFKRPDMKHSRSLPRYYVVYASALILNILLMELWIKGLHLSSWIAPILTLCFTVPYNFVLSRIWVFSDNSKAELKKWTKWLNNNWGFVLFVAVFAVVILCALGMNIYNHPAADDYTNMNKFYGALGDEQLNVFTGARTVFDLSIDTYKTWQGTYFSNVLFFINPLIVSVEAYKITMILIQLLYYTGILYLVFSIKKVTNNAISNKQALTISMGAILFSLAFMMAPSEGLYWFTGTIMYLVPFTMSLFFLGLLMRFYNNFRKSSYVLLLLLAMALGGTSYVTGLFVGLVLLLLSICAFMRKNKNKYYLLGLLLVFVVGFAFNVFCPGNHMRISNYDDNRSIIKALLMSVPLALEMIKYALFNTLLFPVTILLIPIMIRIIKKRGFDCKFKFVLPIVLLLAFITFYVPCAYSYNSFYEETRVKNIQFWYLVMMIEFVVFYVLGTIYKKAPQYFVGKNNVFYYTIGAVLAIGMLSGIGVDNLKTTKMIKEITFGEAREYDGCMRNLSQMIEQSKDSVEINNCTIRPSSLHTVIMTNGEDDWITNGLEQYYGKEIIVKEEK